MSATRSPLRTVDTPWAMVLEHLAAGASAPTVGCRSGKDQWMSHKSCRFWPQVFKFFFFFSGLKYVEFHPSEGTTMFERAMVLISTCGKLKDNWISSFFRCHGNEFMEAVMLLRRSTSCNMPCPWKINRDSNHLEHVLEFIRLLVGTLVLPSPIKIARTSGSTGYLVAT